MSPEVLSAQPTSSANKPESNTQSIRVALAGNPNCGKTTIFNALTGLKYKVANYPGVTVEKKSGRLDLAADLKVELIDLPGIYSFSGNSLDEKIASDALLGHIASEQRPALVICVIDASNLERNLYLASQLIDLEIPIVLALNMMDLAQSRGISIKREVLSRLLDVPIVALTGSKKEGISELKHELEKSLRSFKSSSKARAWAETSDAPLINAASKIGQQVVFENNVSQAEKIFVGLELLADSRSIEISATQRRDVEASRKELLACGIDVASHEATARYKFVNDIVKKSSSQNRSEQKFVSEKIDAFVTHKFWGSIFFLLVMATVFQAIFLWAKLPMDYINEAFAEFGNFVGSLLPAGKFRSLVVDGIIAGVGSVVVFIPQIGLLFFFLSLLEDSGYLSRAAFLMDRIMRKVGLQGRSFIPLLSSFACAIPGIMSTRTIPSFSDRLTTILIAPLMSCSARLPVYTLLIAACIPSSYVFGIVSVQGITLLSMYLLGVLGAAAVAWILKLTFLRGEPALFVMEMPVLRLPSPILALRESLDRIVLFLKSAGTMILACSVILWALASYPGDTVQESYAGRIGKIMEPSIKPLGFNWEIGVGIVASFAAREVFISALATVYNLENTDDASTSVLSALKQRVKAGTFTIPMALSLMVFYVFCCQCMSTLAICKRETASLRWPIFMFVYMTSMAYVASLITFKLATQLLL